MFNIAVFASGSGSNAENLVSYFKDSTIGRNLVGLISFL